MLIIVGSLNPVKIDVIREGALAVFGDTETIDVIGIEVSSGVPIQPMGQEQTLEGARNRAHNAQAKVPEADFCIGFEGGVEEVDFGLVETAYVYVISKLGVYVWSATSPFLIPTEIAKLIRGGMEHGPAADIYWGTKNSKQKEGTIGLVSDNLVTRKTLYLPAIINALLPFKKPYLYKLYR